MGYDTTFQVEVHEPEVTITSNMIRWAIIHLIEREDPNARITHSSVPADEEYAVAVHFVARNDGSKAGVQYRED